MSPQPVCPRHPDRVSYVRCQRCERPTCPTCQQSAAVGVQCIDCVRQQAKTVRSPRTVFGGRVTATPTVTYAVIFLCGFAFLAQLLFGQVTGDLAFVPLFAQDEPWRFVTSMFLHSTSFLPHIAFNMLALYQVGPSLEAAFGRGRFGALYLLSGFGGSVAYLALSAPEEVSWVTSVVGASGAVFGLFGALVVVQRRLGQKAGALYALIGVNMALGFFFPSIAWQSHLGGLITGAAIAAGLAFARGPHRALYQLGAILGVTFALFIFAFIAA
ncbi:MAG: rhomboid family intramembrane serine protease [Actinomycetota bacterium]